MDELDTQKKRFKKSAKSAALALTLSLSPLLFLCISLVMLVGSGSNFHYGLSGFVAVFFSSLSVVSSLVGITIGIRALSQDKERKTTSLLAIFLGVLFLLVGCLVSSTLFAFCCLPM